MRHAGLADIEAAARVLRLVAPAARHQVIAQLCDAADLADKYRKRLGRAHPVLGHGTLMSAAYCLPMASRPSATDPAYLACLQVVTGHLERRAIHHRR
ncbi:hypothetical protein [Yoonia sp. SS1-5]|uniref:DUF7742 domain-containing protein n=1 Tax=Yoonia rhodophyticola TaxID=3137370 RepID=A0AAN0MJ10_9RHOB